MHFEHERTQLTSKTSLTGCLKGLGITLVAGALCMLTLSGCGREAFKVVETTAQQQSPGSFIIPPKVDILLAQDDTGSQFETYSAMAAQVLSFVRGVGDQNWDYHFATIPLTTDRVLTQVAASRYDSNWGSQWKPTYPGELPNGPGTIVPQFFRTLSQYTGLLSQGEITHTGGLEPGFETIRKALYGRVQPTNFMRDDALTVIVIVSNGDDTSLVNYCPQNDGRIVQCEKANYPSYPTCAPGNLQANQGQYCGTAAESFDYYKWQFAGSKSNPNSIRFYSVVSGRRVTDSGCYGGNAYYGGRYMSMAAASGGQSYGICNSTISAALDGISSQLKATRLNMRTRYLFIDQPPNVNTVRVTKYSAGYSYDIPQDATNGWTYAGPVPSGGLYAIDYPIPMNLISSGYAIELHGNARLIGDDSADVAFKPAGAGDTRS